MEANPGLPPDDLNLDDLEAEQVRAALTIERYERGRQARKEAEVRRRARESNHQHRKQEYEAGGRLVIGAPLRSKVHRETLEVEGSNGIYRQSWSESGPLGILHDRKKQEEHRKQEVAAMAKLRRVRSIVECTCGGIFEAEDTICQDCGQPRPKDNETALRKAKVERLRRNAAGKADPDADEESVRVRQVSALEVGAEGSEAPSRSKRKRKIRGQEGIAADPAAREMAAEISGRVDGLEKQMMGLRVLVSRIPEHLKVILDTYLADIELDPGACNAKAARVHTPKHKTSQEPRQLLDGTLQQPESERSPGVAPAGRTIRESTEGPPPLKVASTPSRSPAVGSSSQRSGKGQIRTKATARRRLEKSPTSLVTALELDAEGSQDPLLASVKSGDEARALAILKRTHNDSVNLKDRKNRTVFHWAASRGLAQLSAALLNRHDFTVDNDRDTQGWTALHHGAASGSTAVVRVLLDHAQFSEIDAVDSDGHTALHVAAHQGHAEVCATLLEHQNFNGANVKDSMARTALHAAARNGHVEACRALLYYRRFSEVGAQDFSGYTALDYAAFKGHAEACKVLLLHPRFAEVASKAKGYEGLLALDLVSGEAGRVLQNALQQLRAAGQI